MKRRKFLKNTALGTTAISMPFLLPSGRLFAATGSAMADHLVFVAFAGGVRQQESVLQRYLLDSQDYQLTTYLCREYKLLSLFDHLYGNGLISRTICISTL